jgi:glycerophosphoryl diester phosphodiesterase
MHQTCFVLQNRRRHTYSCSQGLTPNPLSQAPTPIPLVIGHRGSLYEALENTRQSFQRCIEMGCNGFELDVYVIADGTLVIFHGNDSAGRRLGDFSEYCDAGSMISSAAATSIVDLTYQECQQLRFNPNFAEFTCPKEYIAGSRIPTLEEVLKDVQNHNKDRNNKNNKMTVKIELKGPNTVVPVLELVERLNMVDVCCYSSFDLSQLKLLRALRPSKSLYPTGALFAHLPDDFIQKALDVGATEIHIRYDDCTLDRIAIIHQHGLGSMAWMRGPLGIQSDCSKYADVGNEDERMYQALLETGVQQLCVNKPNVLLEMLRWNPTTANVRLPKAEE